MTTTIWPLPEIEIDNLTQVKEPRYVALLTGERSWGSVSSLLDLPGLVVQAEPHRADVDYLQSLAAGLPDEVEVVYGVGGGLVCDVAKFLGWTKNKPVVLVPTALSNDGPFTALVAARKGGTVQYVETGPASKILIDWDVIRTAPPRVRGAAICELLTYTTAVRDWQLANTRSKLTQGERYQEWAARSMAALSQQAFAIARNVGEGRVEALQNLLDMVCLEVQLTNQLGHNRPQEGSEQFFAYAIEAKLKPDRPFPYADLVGPGILVAAALQALPQENIRQIREKLQAAGVRLDQLNPSDIEDTIKTLPQYVSKHKLPYSTLNEVELTAEKVSSIMQLAGLVTS